MAESVKLSKSYLHVPRKFPFSGITAGQSVYEMASKYPENEMFVFYGDQERVTFRAMKEKSQHFAASLISKGLKKGDTIAAWGANHCEWLVALFACIQIGVFIVPLRLEFNLSTVATLIKKYKCKGILLTRSPDDLMDKAIDIIPELKTAAADHLKLESFPDLEFVITKGKFKGNNNDKVKANAIYSFDEFLTLGSESQLNEVSQICLAGDMDDPCLLFFTSGSTGLPKATVVSHHCAMNNIATGIGFRTEVDNFDYDWESARFGMTIHFSGAASMMGMFLPLVRGSTSVCLYPTFNAETMANAIQDERITIMLTLIHHAHDLVHLPNINTYDFSNLDIVAIGGSVIPGEIRHKLLGICKHVTNSYGMTEVMITHMGHPSDPSSKSEIAAIYSVGGIETKIVDTNDLVVPVDTVGQIKIRGYSSFMYYLGDDEKTRESKDKHGWICTGDLALMDEDGFIRIRGRIKELIIKEGLNLAPAELEETLYNHPHVSAALVVGIPDPRVGEEICACIRVNNKDKPSEDEIRHFCNGKVHELLVPKHILFVDEFPTTATGKHLTVRVTTNLKCWCYSKTKDHYHTAVIRNFGPSFEVLKNLQDLMLH